MAKAVKDNPKKSKRSPARRFHLSLISLRRWSSFWGPPHFEAAELLRTAASKRMKWACLGHLSHDNNTPDVALETHRKILGERLPLYVATRYEPSDVMEV